MAYPGNKVEISLLNSICTDEIDQNVHSFADRGTKHPENTGIEREGGLTSIYEQELVIAPASSKAYATEDGHIITRTAGTSTDNIAVDGTVIGQVSSYGVESRTKNTSGDDAVLTADGTYLTCKISGNTISKTEWSIGSNTMPIQSSSVTFTGLPTNILPTSLNFVEYNGMHFADKAKYIIRYNNQAFILDENIPNILTAKYSNLTSFFITASVIYTDPLGAQYNIFGTASGKIFSVDVNGNYKFPDGTGAGAGPYNSGLATNSKQVSAMVSYNGILYVGCYSGLVCSFDGFNWKNSDGTGIGSGTYNNGTVVGSNNILAMSIYSQPQTFSFTAVANTAHALAGKYFTLATATTGYYVWFQDDTGSDPAVPGLTGIKVTLVNGDANTVVATKTQTALNALATPLWAVAISSTVLTFTNIASPGQAVLFAPSVGTSTFTLSIIETPTVALVVSGSSGLGYYNFAIGTWISSTSTTLLNLAAGTAAVNNSQVINTVTPYSIPNQETVTTVANTAHALAGKYFTLSSPTQNYYIWYYDGTGVDPAPFAGWQGIQVTINNGDSANTVASTTNTVLNASWSTVFVSSVSTNILSIYNKVVGPAAPTGVATSTFTVSQLNLGSYGLSIGCVTGIVAYWTGSAWTAYNATGHGTTAPVASAIDVVNSQNINAAVVYGNNFYTVGSNAGLVASYDGANWKKYDATGLGTGPSANQVVVGASNIVDMEVYGSYLIVTAAGRMGTWNGSTWSGYNGIVLEGLYNLGDASHVLIPVTVSCSVLYGNYFVIAGGGYVASFDLTTGWWKYYDGHSYGPSNGPYTASIAGQTVVYMVVLSNWLIFLDYTNGRISSWDGANWKYWNGTGTGTGPYTANYSGVAATYHNAWYGCTYNGQLIVTGQSGENSAVFPTVSSWDPVTGWKYSDGSGTGTGPYMRDTTGAIIGANGWGQYPIMVEHDIGPTKYLVYASGLTATCRVAAWNGASWLAYNSGQPCTNNNTAWPGTVSGAGYGAQFQGALSLNGKLILCNASGRLASYDGANWKNSDGTGTGTGPYAVLPAFTDTPQNPRGLAAFPGGANAFIWVCPAGVSTFDGSNWKYWDGTGTGTGAYGTKAYVNGLAIWGGAAVVVYDGATRCVIFGGGGGPALANVTTANVWQPWNYVAAGPASAPHKNAYQSLDYGIGNYISIWAIGGKTYWTFAGGSNAVFSYNLNGNVWERVYNNRSVPFVFFGFSPTAASTSVTQYKQFLVYTINITNPAWGTYVNSYDGNAWKFWDGTGVGTGPWGTNQTGQGTVGTINPNNYTKACGFGNSVQSTSYGPFGATLTTTSVINASKQYQNYLVLAGNGGNVGSFDGSLWKASDGSGSGFGPFSNTPATLINSANILSMEVYNNQALALGAAGGYIASFYGTIPTNYNAAGTGSTVLAGNATIPITSAAVYAMCNYSYGGTNYLIVVGGTGANGYLASWNGTAWLAYNGTGTGVYSLALNALVASDIRSVTQHGNYLVVGTAGGHIYSFDPYPYTLPSSNLTTWIDNTGAVKNAGAATYAPYSGVPSVATGSTTAVGTDQVSYLVSYQDWLYAFGNTGKLASWDSLQSSIFTVNVAGFPGSNQTSLNRWRTYAGEQNGTGIFSNGLLETGSFSFNVYYYNSILSNSGSVSPYVILNNRALFVKSSDFSLGAVAVDLPQSKLAQVFAWLFESGAIFYGITNNDESTFYLFETNNEVSVVNCKYAVKQVSNGYSRLLLTGAPLLLNNTIEDVALLGYNAFTSTFSSVPLYLSQSAPGAIVYQYQAGIGSAEIVYRVSSSSSNYFIYYAPTYSRTQPATFLSNQSNTNNLVNGFGKLTNAYGLAPSVPFEFRIGWLAGAQSFLSAAVLDGTDDNSGVLLTNVGEIDDGFIPRVVSDNTILYRNNNIFYIIKISTNEMLSIQRVGELLYRLNTLSPLCDVNSQTSLLKVGCTDYHGQVIFASTLTPTTLAHTFVATFQGEFSNSVDAQDIEISISPFTTANYTLVGYKLPLTIQLNPDYVIDVYYDDVYFASTKTDGSELVDNFKTGTAYGPSILSNEASVLPIAIGYAYNSRTMQTLDYTVFLNLNYASSAFFNIQNAYDGYGQGNEITGIFDNFVLYGQNYVYDGRFIYSIGFSNNIFSDKVIQVPGYGLKYLAQSPTDAFFLSEFDNSVFTFTGDRKLDKGYRFSKETPILNGIYSERDNTLLLQATDRFLWIRDKIVTRNLKKANQQNIAMFDTTSGAVILGNNGVSNFSWKYTWAPLVGSTVVPFTWQSGYFGSQGNQKSIINSFVLTFYNAAKTNTVIQGVVRHIDENGEQQQNVIWTIQPNEWSTNGIKRVRTQPRVQRSLASSVSFTATDKIVLLSAEMELKDDTLGVLSPKSSR